MPTYQQWPRLGPSTLQTLLKSPWMPSLFRAEAGVVDVDPTWDVVEVEVSLGEEAEVLLETTGEDTTGNGTIQRSIADFAGSPGNQKLCMNPTTLGSVGSSPTQTGEA